MAAIEWFKVYVGAPRHWKFGKLVERLPRDGASVEPHVWRRSVFGLVVRAWEYLAQYAPLGDLTKIPPKAIAEACDWGGDPEELLRVLAECGFIDEKGGRRTWHKWDDRNSALRDVSTDRVKKYRAKLARKKAAEAKRRAETRAALKAPQNGTAHDDPLKHLLTPIRRKP